MSSVTLSFTESDSSEPCSPGEVRSFNDRIKNPEIQPQEYWIEDKVYYRKKIWEVMNVTPPSDKKVVDKKGNEVKPCWVYQLKIEDGPHMKTVRQDQIEEIAVEGPNHPKPVENKAAA